MMKKIGFIQTIGFIFAFVLLMLPGCHRPGEIETRLDLAEDLMESYPDSSLSILNGVDESELHGSRTKARFALLKTIALDKNYIDTTTFDVLQPAIDFYLNNGNANEKLRTYYYQGIIYENAGDDDHAMQSYLSAQEVKDVSDTLTLARLLVAQGTLFYKQYKLTDFIDNNLKAGELYGLLGKYPLQQRSYSKALDGKTRIKDKIGADSIADMMTRYVNHDSTLDHRVRQSLLIYYTQFANVEKIEALISKTQDLNLTEDVKIILARAYSKIGEPGVGLQYLEEVNVASDNILDSLTYWSVKTEILENLGKDKEALDAFRNYSRLLEVYHDKLFSNELLFSEKKHEMQIENMAKLHKRDNVIKWILAGIVVLVCIIAVVYYRYRFNRAGRLIAERNAENLQLEADKLQIEGERQRLLAEKLEAEGMQLRLETENLRLEVGQLEEERERLTELMKRKNELSDEARQIIRDRIEMLNGLFAQAITEQESYGKEFKNYIVKIKKDKKKFQESIGKVLEATHPDFMKYLRDHGLTEREIDYVCLYVIGLRGKEIGNYLDLARHYNISTDIRRKLGLNSKGENLGPTIRNLMDGKASRME
ncbi:MAG: hypothetical protein K2H38_05965 [Muribaculaceae bacterium]|nr:hypothetical protein [Muribaculaceae bacterium]